jgi:hypothetical protein
MNDSLKALVEERRATVRYLWDSPGTRCAVEAPETEERWRGTIHDISVSGIALQIPRRFQPGTVLEVEVEVKGRAALLPLLMRVVRVAAASDGQWLHGCVLESSVAEVELKALHRCPPGGTGPADLNGHSPH